MAMDMTPSSLAGAAGIMDRTHKWVRFMSVLGFLTAGLMIALGLVIGVMGIIMGRREAVAFMVVYPLLGVLYVIPSLYLYRFASHSREFAERQSVNELEQALESNRQFWKFAALVVAISFGISLAFFIVGVLAGLLVPGLQQQP